MYILGIDCYGHDSAAALLKDGEIIGEERFHLIYMDSDLAFSRKNKPELYRLSEEGKIAGLPGVDIPYEAPASPELICKAGGDNLKAIAAYLSEQKIFPAG